MEDPGKQVVVMRVHLTFQQFSLYFWPSGVASECDKEVWMAIVSDVDDGILCPLVHVSGSTPVKLEGRMQGCPTLCAPTASLLMPSLQCMYCSLCSSF